MSNAAKTGQRVQDRSTAMLGEVVEVKGDRVRVRFDGMFPAEWVPAEWLRIR